MNKIFIGTNLNAYNYPNNCIQMYVVIYVKKKNYYLNLNLNFVLCKFFSKINVYI